MPRGKSSGSEEDEFGPRRTRKFDLDVYECSSLKQALNLALISPIPTGRQRSKRRTPKKHDEDDASMVDPSSKVGRKTSPPASIRDLHLDDDIILDDEDDEYDLL